MIQIYFNCIWEMTFPGIISYITFPFSKGQFFLRFLISLCSPHTYSGVIKSVHHQKAWWLQGALSSDFKTARPRIKNSFHSCHCCSTCDRAKHVTHSATLKERKKKKNTLFSISALSCSLREDSSLFKHDSSFSWNQLDNGKG